MSNTGFAGRPHARAETAGGAARGEFERALVLAVDTATDARSVCVARGLRLLSLVAEPAAGKAGASTVLSAIDETLRRAGVRFEELELFAVAAGPGSFTGLRAGVATVKAFAAVSRRPVAAVPTLHAVACAAGACERTVATLPAGRGEVFAQLLAVGASCEVEELCDPLHLRPSALVEKAARWGDALKWAGSGAHAHRGLIREAAARLGRVWRESAFEEASVEGESSSGWTLAPLADSYAEEIARLGLISSEAGRTLRAEEVRALYVRPSDAELKG